MKILRSELLAGFSDKLFEIPVSSLDLKGLEFRKEIIMCRLSSESIPGGFKLKGSLVFSFLKSCDRCLEKFEDVHNPAFKLWLTSNMDLIKDENIDVIPFPNTMSDIDLKNVFHDFIFLEDSLKYLCSNDCKGLCHHCGLNLNNSSCNCVTISTDTPFDVLESMVR